VTNEIAAATNEALAIIVKTDGTVTQIVTRMKAIDVHPYLDTIHDWVVTIGGADYGLLEYRWHSTFLVLHNHSIRIPFSAPVAAILLSAIVLLLAASILYFVAKLREKGATAPE